MKRFKYIFRVIFAVILINLTTNVTAQDFSGDNSSEFSVQNRRVNEEATAWLDSVDISLLTCGPGKEVWSYYGHTALRIEDKAHGTDVAVNWGMFSFKQDFFILRFVFGLTDYQIGIYPMADFMTEYNMEGRWVYQQRLRLSRTEKLSILRAIDKNNQPENRTYRYNFFFDNCTTRAREMILANIGYNNTNFKDTPAKFTYREEIHKYNEQHRWARFGNDLLLGYQADQTISQREWEFLPCNLKQDFEAEGRSDFLGEDNTVDENNTATVLNGYITLIDSAYYIIQPQTQVESDDFITPQKVAILLAIIIIGVSIFEASKKKNLWWFDTTLLLLTGLPGLILLAMVFSQHPTVQVNFQILILNPLNIIFAWKTIKRMRRGKQYWYFELYGWMLLASLFMQIWQSYAEGMSILAFSLLTRYCIKSTMMDLAPYKHGIQKHIVKQFRKDKYKIKEI